MWAGTTTELPAREAWTALYLQHAAGAVPWSTSVPSITHGLPKHPAMAVPPEALSLTAHHHSAFTHRVLSQPHQVAPRDHLPPKDDKMCEDRREQQSPHHHDSLRSQQEALRHSHEKHHQTLQQEHILRHQIMMEKGEASEHLIQQQHTKYPPGHQQHQHQPHAPSGHPDHLKKQYPMYAYPPKSISSSAPGAPAAAMSTTSSSGSSSSSPGMTSSGHAVKQEPNFSLYGYQPFQPSGIQYISKETLYSQGLKDDKGALHSHHPAHLLKDDPKGHMSTMHMQHGQRSASPHVPHSKGTLSRVSPPPLIKDTKPGTVGSKPKEVDLRQHHSQNPEPHRSPHGLPPPAHSHHGVSGSITLGTALSPRQQPKGLEGRPAGVAGYGGHLQSRPGSSPHPGHMPPSHIHGPPPGQSHHGMLPQQGTAREHIQSNPHPLASASSMQPMDLHKHTVLTGPTVVVSAPSSLPVRDQRAQGPPHQVGPAGYQPPHPPNSSPAAHSYNLIQQGLVPNPIYSHGAPGSRDVAGALDPCEVVAGPSSQHHSPPSTGQKRRSPKDVELPSSGMSSGPPLTHHKKSRIAEAIATSAPAATSAINVNSLSNAYSLHDGPPPASAPATAPSLARNTTPSSTSTGFMDSFRSFVENTVQSAFYQDQELAATKALQQRNPHKNLMSASNIMSTQASPMPSTVSVSSPQATTSSHMTPSTTSSSPFATTATTQAMPPVTMFTSASGLQGAPLSSSSPTNAVGVNALPHSSVPMRPGPASTPGGASVSSTSSIVDTINRVANGYVESDSDTLSASSPPPQRADVTPSPTCRPANHKAFKKAWLQRYSDEDKEKDTSSSTPVKMECTTPPVPEPLLEGSKAGEPVKECYVNCSYISPTKEGGSKSPISLLAKDFRKGDEDSSTTSASEAESQGSDGTTKRRMKADTRRRSSGSSTGSKKVKLSNEDNPSTAAAAAPTAAAAAAAPTTAAPVTTPTTQQTGAKKRFSRKGREGVKDCTNKGLSDDEAVKDRIENEVKSRQVLHNQHHNKHQSSSVNSHIKVEATSEVTTEATNATIAKSSTTMAKPEEEKVEKEVEMEKVEKDKVEKVKEEKMTVRSRTPTTTGVGNTPVSAVATTNNNTSSPTVTTSSNGKKATSEVSDGESTPKENKKRGRKPRESRKDRDRDTTPPRTENLSAILASKPLNKTALVKLKKTLEPFIQDSACPEIAPKLMKCRECKLTSNQRNKKIPNIFCRFYAFRRLRYNQKAILAIAGFSEPADADKDDIELWMPRLPVATPILDVVKAKYVIQHVGDQFCELVEQEKEAMSWVSPDTKVAWKRAVQGVREMCDVCDTTLFNMHWACHKCGFVVCIDCYRQRTRKSGGCMDVNCKTCDTIGQKWLTCSINRQQHEADKLMITQIIPSDALWAVGRMIHEVRDKWNVRSNCPCGRSKDLLLPPKNGVSQLLSAAIKNSPECDSESHHPVLNGNSPGNGDDHKLYKNQATNVNGSPPGSLSPLSLLANVAAMEKSENSRDKKILNRMKEALEFGGGHYNPLEDGKDDDEKSPANCSTLRELLTKTAGRMKPNPENSKKSKTTLDDIIQQVVERNLPKDSEVAITPLLKHYIPKNGSTVLAGRESPIRCYTLTETSVLYPDVPHSWLDSGRLLRLHDPRHKGNLKLWQQQWRRGQPVLVSNCHKRMTRNLWLPDTFAREFGDLENDLVNCRSGVILVGHKMRQFWEGFEVGKKRLKDDKGRKMILKLKDWPPTEDFSEVLPGRFQDLMNGLPLPEYTHRTGIYNMASRLPDFFVKPDLGPKMYNAYGSALYPREGTTNLHLDVSDAVNTMVFVGVAQDEEMNQAEAALTAIDDAGCDSLTKQRIMESDECPGALWHIFDALDADKIRDMLNKIAKERGETIEPHHDPIHDQSWYLDETIRKRLLEEYNVQGYTILQCLGDAVFIPAGAPHQVRNLHSCIKVAEDFVSPENVSYCFKMTQEFRHLSDTHSNHEDKLQVKNIIYHTVKDAVAVLRDANP